MRKLFYLSSIILFMAVTACHMTQKSLDDAAIRHKWMLKTIDSVDGVLVQKSKAYIDLSDTGRASAKAGCNGLGFGMKLSGGDKVSFTQGPSTMMYCAEFMPAENGFVAAMKKVTSYTIKAHKIAFKDKDGKVLITGVEEDWD